MPEPWFVEAFGARYLDVYAHRDDTAAAAEVELALAALGGARRVLDAGCGAGRHARALAGRGVAVVGVDLSAELLTVAAARGQGPRYVRGDVRALPFRRSAFDGVLSFFTSFGYFDEAGNRRHLAELRRVCRPRGRLILDFLNAERVRATLVHRSERELDGRRIVEERAIREGRVEKDVTVVFRDGARRGWRESVRLYTRAELERLLRDARFCVTAAHGDLAGAVLDSASPRCVLIAEAA